RRRLARLRRNERRAVVAVAELSTDHLVRLALLDVRHAREIGPCLGTLSCIVADVRLPHRAPLAPPHRGEARGRDHMRAGHTALALIGGEELRPTPALQ